MRMDWREARGGEQRGASRSGPWHLRDSGLLIALRASCLEGLADHPDLRLGKMCRYVTLETPESQKGRLSDQVCGPVLPWSLLLTLR